MHNKASKVQLVVQKDIMHYIMNSKCTSLIRRNVKCKLEIIMLLLLLECFGSTEMVQMYLLLGTCKTRVKDSEIWEKLPILGQRCERYA